MIISVQYKKSASIKLLVDNLFFPTSKFLFPLKVLIDNSYARVCVHVCTSWNKSCGFCNFYAIETLYACNYRVKDTEKVVIHS
jgi:hypothetical protein